MGFSLQFGIDKLLIGSVDESVTCGTFLLAIFFAILK
jgi:hypothetical protein